MKDLCWWKNNIFLQIFYHNCSFHDNCYKSMKTCLGLGLFSEFRLRTFFHRGDEMFYRIVHFWEFYTFIFIGAHLYSAYELHWRDTHTFTINMIKSIAVMWLYFTGTSCQQLNTHTCPNAIISVLYSTSHLVYKNIFFSLYNRNLPWHDRRWRWNNRKPHIYTMFKYTHTHTHTHTLINQQHLVYTSVRELASSQQIETVNACSL